MKGEEVLEVVQKLKVCHARAVGEVWTTFHDFKNLQSATVRSQKELNLLVATGKLKRGSGWYSTLSYEGVYGDHDRLITAALVDILKLCPECLIHREVAFEPALRSDAVVLLKKGERGCCIILECLINEEPAYLQTKLEAWKHFAGALEALSKLFGFEIPHFSVLTHDGTPDSPLKQFLKTIGG